MRPGPGTCSPGCCPCSSGSSARSTRAPWRPARELRPLDRDGGDAAAARDLFAGLLPVFERVLGPEHPHTLVARGNLARWTGKAGDPAGARDLFAGAAAGARAGPRPGAPGHPVLPAPTSPAGPGRRGTRPGPGTCSPGCCPCSSGSSARSTRAP